MRSHLVGHGASFRTASAGTRDRLLVIATLIGIAACAPVRPLETEPSGSPGADLTPGAGDEAAVTGFRVALDDYVALRQKVASTLPVPPAQADPAHVGTHERSFEKSLVASRGNAKPGQVFVPEVQPLIRRICRTVLTGPEGRQLVADIREEGAPRTVAARVNGRYPDDVPLSSVPSALLESLPRLPEALEYRFLGDDLILLDSDARVIVDVIRGVLPRR
jgi:hypothetical protein